MYFGIEKGEEYRAVLEGDGYHLSSKGESIGALAPVLLVALRNLPQKEIERKVSLEEVKEALIDGLKNYRERTLYQLLGRAFWEDTVLDYADSEERTLLAEKRKNFPPFLYFVLKENGNPIDSSLGFEENLDRFVYSPQVENLIEEYSNKIRKASTFKELKDVLFNFNLDYAQAVREQVREIIKEDWNEEEVIKELKRFSPVSYAISQLDEDTAEDLLSYDLDTSISAHRALLKRLSSVLSEEGTEVNLDIVSLDEGDYLIHQVEGTISFDRILLGGQEARNITVFSRAGFSEEGIRSVLKELSRQAKELGSKEIGSRLFLTYSEFEDALELLEKYRDFKESLEDEEDFNP